MAVKRPEQRSQEAQRYRKLYELPAWRGKHGARQAQLARQPLCERCLAAGKIVRATIVNHRTPHKGDWQLFIDPNNHESLCKPHHDGPVQSEERLGYRKGSTADGRPISADHPWNR